MNIFYEYTFIIFKIMGFKALFIFIFFTTTLCAQLDTNAPWPMFHQNLRHTGQTNTDVLGPRKNPVIKWSYAIGGGTVYSKPIIGKDNTIYFLTRYRLNAVTNGKLKWQYNTPGFNWIHNSIAIGKDDTIYIGSFGYLQAINFNDGSLKWSCAVGGDIYSSPAIDENNTIYIGCDDHKLYAITNGAVKWTNKLGGYVRSSPAIGSDGTIYVGCYDDKLYAISTNGSLQWTNRLGGDIYSSPAIGLNNTIYIGCDDDKLYAITNGQIKWTNRTGGDIKASPAIGKDGTIYIGSLDNKVYAFHPDGTLKWTNRVGDSIYASPVIGSDNTVHIVSADGFVSAFTNGVLKWKKDFNTLMRYNTPAIDNQGILYVARYNTYLFAIIGNNEPQLVWSSNTGYSNDGVEPNDGYNGQYFRFKVKYKDIDNDESLTNQVWVDLDDNGTYENDEKFTVYSNSGTSYSNGIIYTNLIQAFYAGDGIINYKFYFTDKYSYTPLPCAPCSNHSFTVTNTNIPHQLSVTKNTDINGICNSYSNNVVMSIKIWDSKHNHYLTGFQVGNASNMILGTDFSNVQLWYDENENYKWDINDISVVPLKWDGISLWTNNNITFNTSLSYPRNFLVTIDIYTNAIVFNAFKSYIPAKGVKCSGGTNAPLTALTNDGCMLIGLYLNVITNKSIQAVYNNFSNNTIMAIRIIGSFQETLKGFKLGNAGNMVQGNDITNIKLWYDKNGNYIWNNSDVYITNLIWNQADLWTNSNINFTNKLRPYLDIVITADFSLTVTESNTFQAYIPKDEVQCSGGYHAPSVDVTNNGDVMVGQFMGPVDFDLTLGASAVAVGDINNNGYLDIIAAGYNSSAVWPDRNLRKYVNNGDNTFSGSAFGIGKDRTAIAIGDINNDGYLDLVVAGEVLSLYWYLNNGTGSFVFKGSGNGVRDGCVVLGDIDGDGDLDLIASGNYRLDRYINDGTGDFTNFTKAFGIGITRSSIAIGDIDNDGDLDLIVTGYDGAGYRLDKYINDGSSTNFTGPIPFGIGVNVSSIALGDINADGNLDLIVSGWNGSSTLNKYINDGTGNFTRTAFANGFNVSSLALGDIDNDGDLDFIVTGNSANYIYKYINDGTGNFNRTSFGVHVGWNERGAMALVDLDNDNDLDLITAGQRTGWQSHQCVFNCYYNTERTLNNKPTTPLGLDFTNVAGYWRLSWNASSDDHTSQEILRYKVAFGTSTGIYDLSSTNVDYPRGQANLGNVCVVTGTWYQTKISDWKDIYWKVCAIDTSFIRSDYSTEVKAVFPRVHNLTKWKDYSSINCSLAEADNNNHIQADKWSFPEQVNINGFTNLILESTEWANNGYYTNTFIAPLGVPQYGVRFLNSKNVTLRGFTIKNSTNGVFIEGGELNKITHNLIISNNGYSMKINNGTANSIKSNINVYNSGGIEINNSTISTLFRNAIYHNDKHGIFLDDGDNNYIVNNSIASNGILTGDGIYMNNADNNIIKNNIIAFTKNGYGINLNSGFLNSFTYNDVYGNSPDNYNGTLTPGIGSITNNPLWYEYNIYSTNFLYLSNMSPCIDKGDPVDPVPSGGNDRVDMGFKEFTGAFFSVEINKSITNVRLNMQDSLPIPGSTIHYKINCKFNSYGGQDGENIIVYDGIVYNTTYRTDFNIAGWETEYSTNILPNQIYNSTDYTNQKPEKDKIKWIRWKKAFVNGTTQDFLFRVIIK